ncbi:MAG TPA: hypothetical protein VGJ13_13195 [Pseudonocardiaceae bacterium]
MPGQAWAVLADTGSTTLVGAMATDTWQTIRSGMGRLFGHGRPGRQARFEARLDGNATLVAQAQDPDAVRRSLVPVWRTELEALLRRHPDAEQELRTLLAQLDRTPPHAQHSWTPPGTEPGTAGGTAR